MTLRISLAQINLLVGDIPGNADRIIEMACRARDEQQADAVVFPELSLTGSQLEDLLLRPEPVERVEWSSSASGCDINGRGRVAVGLIAENARKNAPAYERFPGSGGWDPGWHRTERWLTAARRPGDT